MGASIAASAVQPLACCAEKWTVNQQMGERQQNAEEGGSAALREANHRERLCPTLPLRSREGEAS